MSLEKATWYKENDFFFLFCGLVFFFLVGFLVGYFFFVLASQAEEIQGGSRAGGAAVGVEAHAVISVKPRHLSSTNLYPWAPLNNSFQ